MCVEPHSIWTNPGLTRGCRLVEPFKGHIMLDNLDLLSLGLDDVRGRIAAIPQVRLQPCLRQSCGLALGGVEGGL